MEDCLVGCAGEKLVNLYFERFQDKQLVCVLLFFTTFVKQTESRKRVYFSIIMKWDSSSKLIIVTVFEKIPMQTNPNFTK